jgi:hypothetical protein
MDTHNESLEIKIMHSHKEFFFIPSVYVREIRNEIVATKSNNKQIMLYYSTHGGYSATVDVGTSRQLWHTKRLNLGSQRYI